MYPCSHHLSVVPNTCKIWPHQVLPDSTIGCILCTTRSLVLKSFTCKQMKYASFLLQVPTIGGSVHPEDLIRPVCLQIGPCSVAKQQSLKQALIHFLVLSLN